MTTKKINFVLANDLGTQFVLDQVTGKYKVGGTGPSTDAGNVLTTGTDDSTLLTVSAIKAAQLKYTLGYNATENKLEQYNSDGEVVSSIDPHVIQVTLDSFDLSDSANGSITFVDKDNGGQTFTLNFAEFLKTVAKANTNAIAISGDGKVGTPITASLVLDPAGGNLLKVGVAGASVSDSDVLALLNANISVSLTSLGNTMTMNVNGQSANATIINSNALSVDATTAVVKSSVNGVEATIPGLQLCSADGTPFAVAFDINPS